MAVVLPLVLPLTASVVPGAVLNGRSESSAPGAPAGYLGIRIGSPTSWSALRIGSPASYKTPVIKKV